MVEALSLTELHHGYGEVKILVGANLSLSQGEVVALTAPSGAGKSTLLHIAGLLERPLQGQVKLAGQNGWAMNENDRSRLRNLSLGFVFQFHHLLPEFCAWENIAMPMRIAGYKAKDAEERANLLLQSVKLDHRRLHRPSELSGGEQQRVAVARALALQPAVLLADEPTGNLDPYTAQTVFELLLLLAHEFNTAALIVTHDAMLGKQCDRLMSLRDGKIIGA